jgi:hypothetical protein
VPRAFHENVSEPMKSGKSNRRSYRGYKAPSMNGGCKTRFKSMQTHCFSAGCKQSFTLMVTTR